MTSLHRKTDPLSFLFTTNPGHVSYPGQIGFAAKDNAAGKVAFTITLSGQRADLGAEFGFRAGFGKFEDDSWHHLLDLIGRACGNAGHQNWATQPMMRDSTSSRLQLNRVWHIGHMILRCVVSINLLHFTLLHYDPYFRATNGMLARHSLQFLDVDWMLISALLLPSYVAFETKLLITVQGQKRELLIDGLFASLWLFACGLELLYGLYRYFPYF